VADRPVPCAGAIVRDDAGRLLLVRRRNPPAAGAWSLPGGRIEPGETAAEAAAREVREETGLVVDVGAAVLRLPAVDGRWDITDFAARVVGGELAPASDASDARWVTDAELARLDTTPGLLDALRGAGQLSRDPNGPS
jgi:8-oxo-dGTP diphosphatase